MGCLFYTKPTNLSWFKRIREGIQTTTREKKDTPEGIWFKCPDCKKTSTTDEYEDNVWCCPHCGHHGRVNSREYFQLFFDEGEHELLFENILSKDAHGFVDLKPYEERLISAVKNSGYTDAISVGVGKIDGKGMVIACMNFPFIGGSMGSVVGERISRGIDYSLEHNLPFMIISKSGGARMMESGFSLLQLAKTSAKLSLLSKKKLPYISLLTNPTTGGVTASFAMLGDVNIAEPKALIGFAGPRVIKETIKKDLPEGFQSSEFVLETGFLDMIVDRKDLKSEVSRLITLLVRD